MQQVLCVGNPNVGKSSLFNQLTGLHQKVANYAGATIQEASGLYDGREVIDLPGLRSLWSNSPDEQVSIRSLQQAIQAGDPLIFVANGLQLEDSMILFSQLADLRAKMCLVINFKDELNKSKISINAKELQQRLNCPVILMNARTGDNLNRLHRVITEDRFEVPTSFCRSMHDVLVHDRLVNHLDTAFYAERGGQGRFEKSKDHVRRKMLIQSVLDNVLKVPATASPLVSNTTRFDKIALHPIWGTMIFLLTMVLLFQSIFSLASYPMDWIDGLFSHLASLASEFTSWPVINSLLADGIIAGIGGVVIFIPQIAILFLLLGLLESSGYMGRISFLSDRLLRKFGLSGSSVVPLLSGMACSIPAIMSARSIRNPKERLAAIMATPLMTCSARLPVYVILIALVVPQGRWLIFGYQGLALLGMYALGVAATLLFALAFSRQQSGSDSAIWILDLPLYRYPHWKAVLQSVYRKTISFVKEAGKIIFIISILLWFLSSFSPRSSTFLAQEYETRSATDENLSEEAVLLEHSYAGYIGKGIEPVIRPLGYDWKIGIALLSSFAAREIFVGSLSTIYSIGSEDEGSILERLRKERRPDGTPVFSLATALSLLIFYAFALQCMSTLAITRQETNSWKWPILQFGIMLGMAYVGALIVYQLF